MRSLLSRFLCDDRGALYIYGVMLSPVLVVMSGAAIDYSNAQAARRAMQHAADSAALAMANAQVLENKREGLQPKKFIAANTNHLTNVTIKAIRDKVYAHGHVKVEIDAKVRTIVMGLVSNSDFDFTVVAEAKFDDPRDIDFTVMIDRSPSMLLGATEKAMEDIGNLPGGKKGCGFACHYDNSTYTKARDAGIDTRLDVAKSAVKRAFEIGVDSTAKHSGEVYGHIYTFTNKFQSVDSGLLSAVLARGKIDKISPDKKNEITGNKYAQTDFGNAMKKLTDDVMELKRKNSDRRPFVLIIVDGVDDYTDGGRKIKPMYAKYCDEMKKKGVTMGVIYTTYFPIYSNNFYNKNVKPFEDEILPELSKCATPGWFFEAQYGEDIEKATREILKMALPKPRLTQ